VSATDLNESSQVQGATVVFGAEFIEVIAATGGHSSMDDLDAFNAFLSPDSNAEAIAMAVLAALDASHSWWPDKFVATGGWRGAAPRYEAWIADLLTRYPAKSHATLFKGLKRLVIKRKSNQITFKPMTRVRADVYKPLQEAGFVVEATANPHELATSLQVAMGRCTA
jgi:CDI immunity protein